MSEFLNMGGYALYVWSAYGIWLVVMIANVLVPVIRLRETRVRLAGRLKKGSARP